MYYLHVFVYAMQVCIASYDAFYLRIQTSMYVHIYHEPSIVSLPVPLLKVPFSLNKCTWKTNKFAFVKKFSLNNIRMNKDSVAWFLIEKMEIFNHDGIFKWYFVITTHIWCRYITNYEPILSILYESTNWIRLRRNTKKLCAGYKKKMI